MLLISCVVLGLWLGVTAILMLTVHSRGGQVTVSFVKAEPSPGECPDYRECERLAFAARNAGPRPVSVAVFGLRDAQGTLGTLGDVEARQSAQLYLHLPRGSHPVAVSSSRQISLPLRVGLA